MYEEIGAIFVTFTHHLMFQHLVQQIRDGKKCIMHLETCGDGGGVVSLMAGSKSNT